MKRLVAVLLAGTCVLFGAGAAFGWNASGKVLCDDTVKTPLEGVTVIVEGVGQTVTDSTGSYNIGLPDVEATYTERLGEGLPPDAVFVIPSSNELILNITNSTCCGQVSFDWLISSSVCKRACWLTGGGVKFSSTSHHPLFNFGGNVNPGCSPTAGNGGQWNHIDHEQNLHFQ